MWNEDNCSVVWTFLGIAFLWNWNENWHFPVLWPLLSFPNVLAYWVQHFHSIIFQDLKFLNWNSITSLALFIVMLSKAHLTSHTRMSGSRWVIIPSRKNEGMEQKQKQYSVVDVSGNRSKIWCCKEQYFFQILYWLWWVFFAVQDFCSCSERGLLIMVTSLVEHRI